MPRVGRPQESEAGFQDYVIQLAEVLGWGVAHFFTAKVGKRHMTPAVGSIGRGFPDLLLVRDGEHIFVELKSTRGQVKPHQREVHDRLKRAGFRVEVWRPQDRTVIERVLR